MTRPVQESRGVTTVGHVIDSIFDISCHVKWLRICCTVMLDAMYAAKHHEGNRLSV